MCDRCWTKDYPDVGNNEVPARGDCVEEWIERNRDMYTKDTPQWYTLDDLLEDYRVHADVGVELSGVVIGPYSNSEDF